MLTYALYVKTTIWSFPPKQRDSATRQTSSNNPTHFALVVWTAESGGILGYAADGGMLF